VKINPDTEVRLGGMTFYLMALYFLRISDVPIIKIEILCTVVRQFLAVFFLESLPLKLSMVSYPFESIQSSRSFINCSDDIDTVSIEGADYLNADSAGKEHFYYVMSIQYSRVCTNGCIHIPVSKPAKRRGNLWSSEELRL